MPPRKRAHTDGESNAQAAGPPKGKKQDRKASEAEAEESASASTSTSGNGNGNGNDNGGNEADKLENRSPYEYYCMNRPFFDFENENEEKDEDEQLDEDEIEDQYNGGLSSKDNIACKPAADHPDHKWILMWQAWKKFCYLKRHALYTNPDAFGMYIYNDFNGYGLQELVQNTVSDARMSMSYWLIVLSC